ncbi:MAG: GNAT family N-acetyltransferase, partial [Leptolyngbya sp. SIO1D8]|nr:GNAT family N-acetyltransferase [Leptolyngbya sp. SIO1D8]
EKCTEFFHPPNEKTPSLTAAREEFGDVPVGKMPKDVYVLGLFGAQNMLLGMMITVRHYPDAQT